MKGPSDSVIRDCIISGTKCQQDFSRQSFHSLETPRIFSRIIEVSSFQHAAFSELSRNVNELLRLAIPTESAHTLDDAHSADKMTHKQQPPESVNNSKLVTSRPLSSALGPLVFSQLRFAANPLFGTQHQPFDPQCQLQSAKSRATRNAQKRQIPLQLLTQLLSCPIAH